MPTVTILQKRIVKTLETGTDPAPLLKELDEPGRSLPTHNPFWGIDITPIED
jgi:hypothetical protein